MDGFLDELDQAFLTVDLGQGPLDFQIDTGFSGAFLIGEEIFDLPDAIPSGEVEADLAADQSHTFAAFKQVIAWLGDDALVPILVGPGKDCLIGTAMFNPHRLEIDYGMRSVRLVANTDWQSGQPSRFVEAMAASVFSAAASPLWIASGMPTPR